MCSIFVLLFPRAHDLWLFVVHSEKVSMHAVVFHVPGSVAGDPVDTLQLNNILQELASEVWSLGSSFLLLCFFLNLDSSLHFPQLVLFLAQHRRVGFAWF